jgi:ParB family transcriptional regulator, chromosome partitioning protein
VARKNLIEVSTDDNRTVEGQASMTAARPIAGFVAPSIRSAPIGGITKTLGNITQKFERAQELERQLVEGQIVVELDPAFIDGSFINDRLGIDPVQLDELVGLIRDHGQQVPILVRPHPKENERYQVAYGHRRVAAAKILGIKVRAVIRELSDDQLVVSQGQENNARTDLSYIERSLFAARLEDRTFSRDIIMSALGVDKAALSKMISVVRQIPLELIEFIGAAPTVGRRRWMELTDQLVNAKVKDVIAQLSADNSTILSSDQRFQKAVDILKAKPNKSKADTSVKAWAPADKSINVVLKKTSNKATVTLEAANGLHFANWISNNLESLYETFRNSTTEITGD